jgi:DNA (cytosine-5)-methyltransferase 1
MVGIRKDIKAPQIQRSLEKISINKPLGVEMGFLPKPAGCPPSLPELLSDLEDPSFLKKRSSVVYPKDPSNDYQKYLRTSTSGKIFKKGDTLTEQEYSAHADYIRDKFRCMIANDGKIPDKYKTKKFAQRVFPRKWPKGGPNITATSLPEDYVHYKQPRGPTVREWARIQTFPDWYQFKGPRTTGGRRRAGDPSKGIWDRDVPRYTQIGNAVPVWLASAIGRHLVKILS